MSLWKFTQSITLHALARSDGASTTSFSVTWPLNQQRARLRKRCQLRDFVSPWIRQTSTSLCVCSHNIRCSASFSIMIAAGWTIAEIRGDENAENPFFLDFDPLYLESGCRQSVRFLPVASAANLPLYCPVSTVRSRRIVVILGGIFGTFPLFAVTLSLIITDTVGGWEVARRFWPPNLNKFSLLVRQLFAKYP